MILINLGWIIGCVGGIRKRSVAFLSLKWRFWKLTLLTRELGKNI